MVETVPALFPDGELVVDPSSPLCGQILIQRAAECDVQYLVSAADPEYRLPFGHGPARERKLGRVALGMHLAQLRNRLLAVQRRCDVHATCQQQPIHPLEHHTQRVDVRCRGQNDRYPAGLNHTIYITLPRAQQRRAPRLVMHGAATYSNQRRHMSLDSRYRP